MKKKKSDPRVGKKSSLKISTKRSGSGGSLVFAVIGDYKGKGKQRVILHEVTVDWENKLFAYGNKRCWNFPVK